MIGLEERIAEVIERQEDMLSNVNERANTATFRVSPDGDNTDGLSQRTAYQTFQAAYDAASADVNDLTLILLAPGTYDIDTTGDPNFTKNVVIRGSHRNWVTIVNNHASATAVIGFTGYVALKDLTIDCGTGSNDGVIIAGAGAGGARVDRVYIECDGVTGAQTGLAFGGGVDHVRCRDLKIHGVKANTRGLQLNNCEHSDFQNIEIADCLEGLEISNTSSDENHFQHVDIDNCTLGIDINGGNNQIFHDLTFSRCTRNIDDEVGDHVWININGRFDIDILPDNFTGITVSTGGAGVYGADTEILSAVSRDNPFRIVGTHLEPSTSEWYRLRLSDDGGTTFFDVLQFDATKREGAAAQSGTEHIFNAGTRISGSSKDVSGGDNVKVWLEVQEI